MIHSELLEEKDTTELLSHLDGLLVAPGFGTRGVEGKISAIKFARENNIPFLGICLGMQCAVIEFARNVLGMEKANSTEFNNKTPWPVIDMMEEQKKISGLGGTMRLGKFDCTIQQGSKAFEVYQSEQISERHRHRYEFNNKFADDFSSNDMQLSGINKQGKLIEIIELKNHPWFIGVQFHPEYKSTVANPHPLFVNFVKAAKQHAAKKNAGKK